MVGSNFHLKDIGQNFARTKILPKKILLFAGSASHLRRLEAFGRIADEGGVDEPLAVKPNSTPQGGWRGHKSACLLMLFFVSFATACSGRRAAEPRKDRP